MTTSPSRSILPSSCCASGAWRAGASGTGSKIARRSRIGECILCPAQSTLTREGASYLLTELELGLLMHLWRKRGSFVSREELLVEVWGYSPDTVTRTVDIFVSRLRRMLGDDGAQSTAADDQARPRLHARARRTQPDARRRFPRPVRTRPGWVAPTARVVAADPGWLGATRSKGHAHHDHLKRRLHT